MAPKRLKAFLPRWILAVMIPFMIVVWGIVTYVTFMTDTGRQDPGVLGWAVVTVVLILVVVLMWLMTGRLPAYIIEMDIEEDR